MPQLPYMRIIMSNQSDCFLKNIFLKKQRNYRLFLLFMKYYYQIFPFAYMYFQMKCSNLGLVALYWICTQTIGIYPHKHMLLLKAVLNYNLIRKVDATHQYARASRNPRPTSDAPTTTIRAFTVTCRYKQIHVYIVLQQSGIYSKLACLIDKITYQSFTINIQIKCPWISTLQMFLYILSCCIHFASAHLRFKGEFAVDVV